VRSWTRNPLATSCEPASDEHSRGRASNLLAALGTGREGGRRTFDRVVDDVVSHLVHDGLEPVGGDEGNFVARSR
jgi:hypothetical protein